MFISKKLLTPLNTHSVKMLLIYCLQGGAKTGSTSARRPLDCNTSKARRLPCPKNPAPRLPEDLWTTKHQRPEGYHAQKTGSTSARRPFDCNTSKARRLPSLKNQLHFCHKTFRPQNTSKARRLPYPKNRKHVCQKTFGFQHIKGQKATMPKKPA